MTDVFTRVHFEAAVAAVRAQLTRRPTVGLVLGSGLGALADLAQAVEVVDLERVPHWPRSTVEGHAGRLLAGEIDGRQVLIQQGRAHYYEGYSLAQVTLPVRVMQLLGIRCLILTSAAGGLNPALQAGDVMLITDHLNLMGLAGMSPLIGPNDLALGPRFPDMSWAYDRELQALAEAAARAAGVSLQRGIYACVAGPAFETPAEVRFLRQLGADAVAMSLAPEVAVARHGGLRVLALAAISNPANADGSRPPTHLDVLTTAAEVVPRLGLIVRGVLRRLTEGAEV